MRKERIYEHTHTLVNVFMNNQCQIVCTTGRANRYVYKNKDSPLKLHVNIII